MIYKIIHKVIGVKQVSLFSQFDLQYEINDFCFVKNEGFFFTSNQCIGHIGLDGNLNFPFIGQENNCKIVNGCKEIASMANPFGIYFSNTNKKMYVSEQNGRKIRTIDTVSNYYVIDAYGNANDFTINKYLYRKNDGSQSYVFYGETNLVWTNDISNYIFCLNGHGALSVYGDGKSGFSYSNHKEKNRMNCPSGICFLNGLIYVADKNNKCIRFFGEINGLVGHPITGEINPGKLVPIKESLYFINGCGVKHIHLNNMTEKNIISVIENINIVSICEGDKNQLAILIKD